MSSTSGLTTFVILTLFAGCYGEWPVIYKKLSKRAPLNPACAPYVQKPFCDGEVPMPSLPDNHSIEVYFLEHKILDMFLFNIHIWQSGIGFKDINGTEGNNQYSLTFAEWDSRETSALFPYTNGSQPPLWCNQGAACFNQKIDNNFWNKDHTIKVANITGKEFNKLSEWVKTQNQSYSYDYPFTSQLDSGGQAWFEPWSSGAYVQAAFWNMYFNGAKFDTSQKPKYTTFNLYSEKPISLGHETELNQTVVKELNDFFADFQSGFFHQIQMLIDLIEDKLGILVGRPYYMYFNQQYWQLKFRGHCFTVDYNGVNLPQK